MFNLLRRVSSTTPRLVGSSLRLPTGSSLPPVPSVPAATQLWGSPLGAVRFKQVKVQSALFIFCEKYSYNIKHLDKNLVAQMHCFSWRGYILDCITHPWKTRLCLSLNLKHICNRGLPLLAKLFCSFFSHVLLNLGNLFFFRIPHVEHTTYTTIVAQTLHKGKNTSPCPGGRESSFFNPTGSFFF